MNVLSINNQKGGVGKTTVSVNMAITFAQAGYRVLVVDNDKQGNATTFFGVKILDDTMTLADLYTDDTMTVADVVQHTHYERLDILPSDINLKAAELTLPQQNTTWQTVLRQKLAMSESDYDICLIDNPPDASALVMNALTCCNSALIIVGPDEFSLNGVKIIRKLMDDAAAYNPALHGMAIFNKYKPAGGVAQSLYAQRIQEIMPVLSASLRNSNPGRHDRINFVERAMNDGKAVFEISPGCGFARDFVNVMNALMEG